jgi:hypothetical protein
MIKNRITRLKKISPKKKIEDRRIKKIKSEVLKKIKFYQNPEFD